MAEQVLEWFIDDRANHWAVVPEDSPGGWSWVDKKGRSVALLSTNLRNEGGGKARIVDVRWREDSRMPSDAGAAAAKRFGLTPMPEKPRPGRAREHQRVRSPRMVRAPHKGLFNKLMDPFTRAYIEAALWSTNDESDESGGEPFDRNYSLNDIADETLDKMIADCADFQERFGELIEGGGMGFEHGGHDFWLTRNGHGAGFWDGDWEEPQATALDKAAKSYGEFDLYLGDDGQIHGSPLERYTPPSTSEHRVRAKGIYGEMPFAPKDYVIHYREDRRTWSIDRVGAGGTHTTIGPTRGYGTMEQVRAAIEHDAHVQNVPSAQIHDAGGDLMGEIRSGRVYFYPGSWAKYSYQTTEARHGKRVQNPRGRRR